MENKELTEEKKKEMSEKFLRSAIINKNKSILKAIISQKTSINELLNQIDNKTCKLSRDQRDFLKSFKVDFIEQLINDYKEYVRP